MRSASLFDTLILERRRPCENIGAVQFSLTGSIESVLLFGTQAHTFLFFNGLPFDPAKLTKALQMPCSVHKVEIRTVRNRLL